MIKLSHITSYLTCPRLAYYRLKFGEDSFTEKHAVKGDLSLPENESWD
ncbi:MAG: hypothetical protein QXK44_00835 [Archaeoglobaceae archaeon]